MTKLPFENDADARRFYTAVFFHAVVNLRAYQLGAYPTLLCETEDPLAAIKWKEALPDVLEIMRHV